METIIIIVLIVLGFVIVSFLVLRKSEGSVLLQNQLNELSRTVDQKMGESTKIMQSQFGESTKIIKDVTEKLTRLDETNKQVLGFSDQLRNLQDILKNPKQRGIFGEYYLETLLKNAFHPKQYQMQYQFSDGEIVDAVLFLGDQVIPIDSKFSLENYNRIVEETDTAKREDLENIFKQDLKKRIDETAKYIRPNENTTEFAFMFIPAEGIYYDLLVNKVGAIKVNTRDLVDYAINEKHVHIVSPTTFYVTLQSMWQGMKAYQIQESTKDLLKNVGMLENHLKAHEDYLKKLGNHLSTSVNTYNKAYKELGKVDKDFLKITGGSMGV
ncbi:DNA recombination protein RmuC, partial [Patescibacteria group bacterium]